MARQVGEYRFEGTIDGLCCYKMEGEYYVRKQSSLTGKRFWKAGCFEASRRSCQRLSRGSQLAAMVYNTFRKQKGMYAALKSKAIALLKSKTPEVKVLRKLQELALNLQPQGRHSSKYIRPVRIQKKKAKTIASLFGVPPINGRIDYFNRYLCSA
jgi:hypothetical protein